MLQVRDINIYCPYCGEMVETSIDESAGSQSYYEDCQVCCAPILFELAESASGEFEVYVRRDDE